jgi:hypothetical protein
MAVSHFRRADTLSFELDHRRTANSSTETARHAPVFAEFVLMPPCVFRPLTLMGLEPSSGSQKFFRLFSSLLSLIDTVYFVFFLCGGRLRREL